MHSPIGPPGRLFPDGVLSDWRLVPLMSIDLVWCEAALQRHSAYCRPSLMGGTPMSFPPAGRALYRLYLSLYPVTHPFGIMAISEVQQNFRPGTPTKGAPLRGSLGS